MSGVVGGTGGGTGGSGGGATNASRPELNRRPRDARVISSILSSMGVQYYDPRVIHLLLEFVHRYISDSLKDAQVYAQYAGRPNDITKDDLQLATQAKVDASFSQPPPREFMLESAQRKNSVNLPVITPRYGVHLPADDFCLAAVNYQVDTEHRLAKGLVATQPVVPDIFAESIEPTIKPADVPMTDIDSRGIKREREDDYDA